MAGHTFCHTVLERLLLSLVITTMVCAALPSCSREVFYGEWLVTRVVAWGKVNIYGWEGIDNLVGQKITYRSKQVSLGDDVCSDPQYVTVSMSRQEWEKGIYISFNQMGIDADSAAMIEVFTDQAHKESWDSVGNAFFIKDENTLLAIHGGVCLELSRLNAAPKSTETDISEVREAVRQYEQLLVDAINSNDFSRVQPAMVPCSPLYYDQMNLVSNLNKDNIQERLISCSIDDVKFVGAGGVFQVYVSDTVGIKYPDRPDFEAKEFKWIYTVKKDDGKTRLSSIRAWESQ